MLLLRILVLALTAAAAVSDADCEAPATDCSQAEVHRCSRAASEGRRFTRRCLQPKSSSRRRRPRWCRCCRSACQPAADSVGIGSKDDDGNNEQRQHVSARRRLRRQLRRLVRRLGDASVDKRPVNRRREVMMQRLLDLELRLLSLRRDETKSSLSNHRSTREGNESTRGRVKSARGVNAKSEPDDYKSKRLKDKNSRSKDKSARDRDESARGRDKSARGRDKSARGRDKSARGRDKSARGRDKSARGRDKSARGRDKSARGRDKSTRRDWTTGSLEQRYFVDSPVADIAEGGSESPATGAPEDAFPYAILPAPLPTTGWTANSSDMLAWLSHLEDQRTAKVKAACHRVSCNRAKGELCLANIQDLPVCRCVTNVNCVNERRRLRQRRGRHRRRRRRRRQRREGVGNWTTTTATSVSSLTRQFSGRVCAQLSGLPAERTYASLCLMHAAVCSSDSQVLRQAEGPCANHDPESEALETLTDQKCARCLARAWRGRGCKRWRRQCQTRRI